MIAFDFGKLQAISTCNWSAIHAMPVQNKQTALLDIVFVVGGSPLCILAQERTLPDGDESFCLDIQEFKPGGWWKEAGVGISAEWQPRRIHDELINSGLAALLVGPRRCRAFFNGGRAVDGDNRPQAVVAFEFSKMRNQELERIVLAASQDFPCTMELGITKLKCDKLLDGLSEIQPLPLMRVGNSTV